MKITDSNNYMVQAAYFILFAASATVSLSMMITRKRSKFRTRFKFRTHFRRWRHRTVGDVDRSIRRHLLTCVRNLKRLHVLCREIWSHLSSAVAGLLRAYKNTLPCWVTQLDRMG